MANLSKINWIMGLRMYKEEGSIIKKLPLNYETEAEKILKAITCTK